MITVQRQFDGHPVEDLSRDSRRNTAVVNADDDRQWLPDQPIRRIEFASNRQSPRMDSGMDSF